MIAIDDETPDGEPRIAPEEQLYVTRLLCATAHLRGSFADYVTSTLLKPSFEAVGPSWGVDLVALGRHAVLSRRRRLERDRWLRYTLLGTVVGIILVLAAGDGAGVSFARLVVLSGVIVIAAWLLAWWIVTEHYRRVRQSALDVMDQNLMPRASAPPIAAADEARLATLARANVVIFHDYLPFVGSGVVLDTWTMTLDVERGRPGPQGQPVTALPFNAADVYDHLKETVPHDELADVTSRLRMHVFGWAAETVPGLIQHRDDPRVRPPSWMPEEVLRQHAIAPTAYARTYLAFEKSSWRGEVLVSMLLRVQRTGRTLFIEGRAHALLPLRGPCHDVERLAQWTQLHSRRSVAFSAARVAAPLLTRSWARHWQRMQEAHISARQLRRLAIAVRKGHPVNRGASSSIREKAQDLGELQYNATVDEVMYFQRIKREILRQLGEFLARKQVDLAEFHDQVNVVMHQTMIHLHDVDSADRSFGENNTSRIASVAAPTVHT